MEPEETIVEIDLGYVLRKGPNRPTKKQEPIEVVVEIKEPVKEPEDILDPETPIGDKEDDVDEVNELPDGNDDGSAETDLTPQG